jgi:tetratricopeptide (TPR) repeat protein
MSERERRAKAYAKLLEGQRYFQSLQTGMTMDILRRSRDAFKQAAELDPTLSEAHTALAEIALFFDDLQQSELEGQAATRLNPDNLGAHRILSRVYTVKSKLAEKQLDRATADKAVAELLEVARVHPNDAEAWALLAEFYVATGREKEAIEALQKWATLPAAVEGRFYQVVSRGRELTPDAANAYLAEVFLKAGRTQEAVAAIRQAISIEPENPRYLQMLGDALEANGSADTSVIEELGRIVAQQPQNAAAVQMLARAQSRAGRVDDAIKTLRTAIAAVKPGNDRDSLTLQVQLAEIFADASRYDEAVAVYEALLKSHNIGDEPLGNDRDRRFAVGALSEIVNLRKQAGQADEALAAVERMRRLLGNSDPDIDRQKIDLLRSFGRRAEALQAARDARKRFPEELDFLRLEATALSELGRTDEGLNLLKARLKGDAGDFIQYLFISNLLAGAGRGTEAVEAARKALELAPADNPNSENIALLALSTAQDRAGDAKGSEETLRKLLAKDPENSTALNNLGYYLTERNERLEEALEMIQRAVRAEPTNASFLDSLGWVYFKMGKLNEAERYLSDAARRNQGSATIQEHLGDLFQRIGQHDKAMGRWRKALSLSVEAADTARIKAKLNGETK